MTKEFHMGEELPADLLAWTESLFRRAAEVFGQALDEAQSEDSVDPKAFLTMSRDLKTAFDHVMQERTRLEKSSRNAIGANGERALNLDDAREEIQRRLACLRTAGSDE
jgi:hypothetical protein